MRLRAAAVRLFFVLGAASALGGCELVRPAKVASGRLYQSGDGRYDPFFGAVHQEQVAAGSWPEEARAARRPVSTALNLDPDASSARILSAVSDRAGTPSLGPAIEQTVARERERARRLGAAETRLRDLARQGAELGRRAEHDAAGSLRRDELRRETAAAVDVVEALARSARRNAEDAEELASKLRATSAKAGPIAPPRPSAPAARRPPPAPAAEPPPPAPKPPEEIFRP